jgi:hypothetical protein
MTAETIPEEAKGLGEIVRDYRGSAWERLKSVLLSAFVMVVAWAFTVGLFINGAPKDTPPSVEAALRPGLVLGSLAVTAWSLWCVWSAIKERDTRLLVFNDGLALVQAGTVRTCRWGEIKEVIEVDPQQNDSAYPGPTILAYVLKVPSNKDWDIASPIFGLSAVGEFAKLLQEKLAGLPTQPVWTQRKA